ncbi:META domain-containing protein [Viscerimonas tarda]
MQLDGKWTLKTFNGKDVAESFKGGIPTLEFNITEKRISGSGGCNNYSGVFILTENEFSAPNVVSTQKMCFAQNQESAFYQLLAEVSTLSLNGENLIFTQKGKQVLVFVKEKTLNLADLTGVSWVLQSIEGSPVDTYFKGTSFPGIEFDAANNSLKGNAGCNTYNAPFTLTGNTLTVSAGRTTRRACENMEGEQKFVGTITGASNIELNNNNLVLKKNGVEVLRFTKNN